ncbi:MAG: hypothetical protein ACRBB3_01970 [Alphaproteobacteria bacterium]
MTTQTPSQEDNQPGLNESDILPFQQEDRTADNPMGTLMNFLGLSMMADLTISTLETVGSLDGGLDMTAITPEFVAPAAPDLDFGIDSNFGGMAPPSITSPV